MGFGGWLCSLRSRKPAQNTLEYALVAATIAIASIAGLSALQGAEGAYFTGLGRSAALNPTPIPCGASCTALRSYFTTISCTSTSLAVLNTDTCTVTVQDTSASPTNPTGSVAWSTASTGTFSGQPCTLSPLGTNSGQCSVTYQPTVIGSHQLTATYTLTPQLPGTIATTILTVSPRSVTASVSCSPGAGVMLSTSTTCTVLIIDSGGPTPTGTITWTSTGTGTWAAGSGTFTAGPPPTCALTGSGGSASCSVNYTPTVLGSGTHTIAAAYGGDSIHGSASPTPTYNVGVVAIATTTTVSCSPSPDDANVATTCTATVSGGATPTGTVSWTFNGPPASSPNCTLNASGACAVTFTPTAAGTQTLSAAYAGDGTHAASGSGPINLNVNTRSTSVSVSCTGPVTYNAGTSTCTATATDTDSGTKTTPSGTITWSVTVGSGSFGGGGTCTLAGSGGTATCTGAFTPGAPGTDTIKAGYGGDTMHNSGSGTGPLTVNKRTSGVAVSCAPSSITVDGAPNLSTCSATVSDTSAGTKIIPTGTVNWSATGGGSFGSTTCPLSGTGSCSVTYTPVAGVNDSITATYAGDVNFTGNSGNSPLTVNLRTTTTTVTCSPANVATGQSSVCTAVVQDTSGGTLSAPTGAVAWSTNHGSFSVGGGSAFSAGPPPTCTLAATGTSGQSACSVTFTRANGGSITNTGAYGADAKHAASSGQATMP